MNKIVACLAVLIYFFPVLVQSAPLDLKTPFNECNISGSITIYDLKKDKWIYSDPPDSMRESLPASTFKILNSLIALETGAIKDEKQMIKFVDTQGINEDLYGHRPEIYKDMNLQEAFEKSAVWFYLELAKKIGRNRYHDYIKKSRYGNLVLSEKGLDFWNVGYFGISPANQVNFLKDLYQEKLPFSKRNFRIVKKIMTNETNNDYILRAKTGWTQFGGRDSGWWAGYVELKENVFFFATRINKDIKTVNPKFVECRKTITRNVLKQLGAIN